ncbi:GTP 3',8-cyclase MoaA [Chloroflexota bacterium]
MTRLMDSCHRAIDYLRVSVTDRCNLSCIYCTPVNGVRWLPKEDLLTYEEITTIAEVAAELGITKVRLTGGEPLVRTDVPDLIDRLAHMPAIRDISLTTNGILLKQYARELKKAGLKRVNISLDTLDRARFRSITRHDRLADVMKGIEAAKGAGLDPVKINVVAMCGVNDDEILDFARLTISDGWHVRFIELMPFAADTSEAGCGGGSGELLQGQFMPVSEIQQILSSLGVLEIVAYIAGNGPAKYFRLPQATGTIGFISAVSQHFCDQCNRLRLTADGKLRLCLFSDDEIDLRVLLRGNTSSRDALKEAIVEAVKIKPRQHQLSQGILPGKRFMSQVGG